MSNKAARSSRVPLRRQVVAGLLFTGILLLLCEIAARFLGPAFRLPPYTYVASGHEEYFGTARIAIPYRTHRPYYWVPMANTPLTNNKGFRGRDWVEDKSSSLVRVACLGCSCTMGGQEPYAQRMDRLFREALGPGHYEVLNAGVGSSSTYQILQILEHHVLPMKPDVLIVYSGWNDLAIHDGIRDKWHTIPRPWQRALGEWLNNQSALFQVVRHAAGRWRLRHGLEQRVPIDDYKANLRRIVELGRQAGARVVLCTFADRVDERIIARRATRQAWLDWDNDLFNLFSDKADTPDGVWQYIVDRYHSGLREVADAEHATVVDLDAELPPRDGDYEAPSLRPVKDGIHFTELGHQEVANILARAIASPAEREKIDKYLAGPEYFWTNAQVFASQFQYAAAQECAQRAAELDLPDSLDLRYLLMAIATERPFYDDFDRARFEASNGGDPEEVAALYRMCYRARPDNDDVRIDLAEALERAGHAQEALDLAMGQPHDYAPANMSRALWLGVKASQKLGRHDLEANYTRELVRRFPNDPLAKAKLRSLAPR